MRRSALRCLCNSLLPVSLGIHEVHDRMPAINVGHLDLGRKPKEDEGVIGIYEPKTQAQCCEAANFAEGK